MLFFFLVPYLDTKEMDLQTTGVVILIAAVGFFVITAWDEVIDRWLFDKLKLDRNKISSWVIVATITTIALILLLLMLNIELHDVIGIGEAVDVRLTGKTERFVKGKVRHSR